MSKTNKIGLFWGSDTGVTEEIVSLVNDSIGEQNLEIVNVFNGKIEQFQEHQYLLLALSTWYDGELQSDWDEFFEEFKKIDFSGKEVAIIGTGDQEGYTEYFIDGVGILAEVVLNNGGRIIGKWSTDGYDYEASKAEMEKGYFMGLAIDEDNQPELTDERLEKWLEQIKAEYSVTLW